MIDARLTFLLIFSLALPASGQEKTGKLRGKIIDGDGLVIPARLYVESIDDRGRFHHAKSTAPDGSAVPYEKKRGVKSVEIHTCLSADPFETDLPPGKYRLTAERGHEYLPATVDIEVTAEKPADAELVLKRWIHLADRGWFSGDTHCHRNMAEMPTVLLAEDLNVGLPLTSWVTDSTAKPTENNKNPDAVPPPRLIHVDSNHVIWPVNTEYEIFTVEKERHTLGAIFVLNHREQFDLAVPPVTPLAEAARKQGGLLDLDKHNWPWSMMLPPIMDVQLFELTNNHVWRTEFAFTNWYSEYVPAWMGIPLREGEDGTKHLNERGWLEFGFRNYYSLLNCGLRILPSGGTASGVHPVPLGFGRVYARIPDGDFSYDKWIDSLRDGQTFVTTGPMLFATVNEKHPGSIIEWEPPEKNEKDDDEETEPAGVSVLARVECQRPIEKLELVVNGTASALEIGGPIGARAPHSCFARATVPVEHSSWIALRVFTRTEDGRPRFAHTAPFWVTVNDKPLRPDLVEASYLLERVQHEIERHQGVLSDESLAEFEKAAAFFQKKRDEAYRSNDSN